MFKECRFAGDVTIIRANQALVQVRNCVLLTASLGWEHSVSLETCENCMNNVGFHQDPDVGYSSTLDSRFRHLLMHPLRIGMSEDAVQKVLNTTRERTIERALSHGIEREDILEALIEGVKRGLPQKRALSLADKFSLFEDTHA